MQTNLHPTEFAKVPTRVRRSRLVEEHESLVRIIARQVGSKSRTKQLVDADDLFTVGVMGLFEAEKNYDPETGHAFKTFASFRIRGAMLDELRRWDLMPRRLRRKSNRLDQSRAVLSQSLGREPNDEEIAAHMGIEVRALTRIKERIHRHQHLSADEGIPLRCNSPDALTLIEEKERAVILVEALDTLSEREKQVLDLYYTRELTLKEIAEIYEVTEGRISQIKSSAIRKLSDTISERGA